MTKFEDTLKKAGIEYRLSDDERAKMTHVVREYMAHKPLLQSPSYSISMSYSWFTFAHRPLAAALVLVLVFGSGVSYAAESALPGDALYTVKTYINEPARVALATNAEAKANIQIELAERRIDEAATLASEGRLDADTQTELATAFESHASAASEHIEKTDETDSPAAAELASRFETRLAAHDEVLAEVQSDTSAETHDLSEAIHGAGRAVALIRTRAEEKAEVSANIAIAPVAALAFAAKSTPTEATVTEQATTTAEVSRSAALRMQKAANSQRETMRKKAEKNSKKTDADSRAKIDTELSRAEELIAIGEAQIAEGDIALAFHSFQDSLVITEKLSVMLKSAPALAKAYSRKGASDRTDPIRERPASNGAGIRNNENAKRDTATMELTATMPLDIKINTDTSIDVQIEVQNVLPPTITIFPSQKDERDDEDEDHEDKKNDVKVNISL